jgi:branched-chain amino acid transport system substrate-binding protein
VQMAVDRINKSGGINGRPVELVVADDQSKPDTGRRAVEKLATEDGIDFHVGGFLSNICLACTPVWEEHKIVNMIGVCLDKTLTTSKCSRYTFRTFDFAPAQAKSFAPYLVTQIGKKWHILYADYSWGQSTRDAYIADIKANGGEVVGSTGIPLGTADTTSFLSKIGGDFDGLFLIFFGSDAINVVNQGTDLGLAKTQIRGRRRRRHLDPAAGDGQQNRGLCRHRPLFAGVRSAARHPRTAQLLR